MKAFTLYWLSARFREVRDLLTSIKELITMNHAQLVAELTATAQQITDAKTELVKAQGEVVAKIAALQAAVDVADNVPQSVVDALAALQATVPPLQQTAQDLDNIVPDAPAP